MVVSGDDMTHYPYILFNQSPEDLRRIGARGGKAYGRNHRSLRAQRSKPLEAMEHPVLPGKRPRKRSRPWMRSFPGCEVPEIAPLGGSGELIRFTSTC
jgi:hypothetical protein